MRVVICDDERAPIDYLAGMLQKKKGMEVIGEYTEQSKLLELIEKKIFPDIVFMDIDWKDNRDGVQLSKILFEKSPKTQIIYVTGYNDRFSQQIFLEDSNLCGYLVKPVQEELLDILLSRADEKKKTEKLIFSQRGVTQAISYEDICYLESSGHHTIIHTVAEVIQVYDKLETFKGKLSKSFAQCHKSFVVNMDYISYIDKNHVELQGIAKISISKGKYKEFRERYFSYMGAKM